jgi:putative ABC transport system permease protein
MKLSERVYRFLLRLLPNDFRGEFGDSMVADVRSSGRTDGAFWRREIRSLIAAAIREHASALRQDVKYAFRMMRRTPGFTVLAVLMLALGTGVNAAMFSVVDAVMLRSPFKNPDQLAFVRVASTPRAESALVPAERFPELASAPAFASVAVLGSGTHVLTGAGDPRSLDNIECVSAAMFDVLRTRPLIGRTFDPAEDQPGASPTIVLAYTFWKELGGAASILGTPLTINGTPTTVIGVMPRGFYGPQARPNTSGWLPYNRPIKNADNAGCRQPPALSVVARLQDGLTRQAAAQRMPGFNFEVVESVWMDTYRTPLYVLTGAVACVLLIACLNVGGLQMERTLARRRELSLRLALGAGRGRLIRQIVTESLVFALVGAIAGAAATAATLQALISILPPNIPYLAEIQINMRVLLVTMAVAAAAGLLSGIFPILETRRFSAGQGLAASSRATDIGASWTRRGLVVAEIALSIVVLIGAGLMIQTFLTLRPSHPGFDPDHKLWQPARLRGATPEANAQFYADLFDRLRGAPGIAAVAGTTYVPMIAISNNAVVNLEGAPKRILSNAVTPNYFAVMKIPMRDGRAFTAGDTAGSEPVVIINDTLARRIKPGGQVIGERIAMNLTLMGRPGPPSERTIVGVIANTRGSGIDTTTRSEAYLPYAQIPGPQTLIVDYLPGRSAEAAAAVRAALRELRPDFAITPAQELREMIDKQVATPRFGAWLLGIFASLAVILAAIGLMTTIGWWVHQRTRELGVRMALGATRGQITGLVLRQGMTIAALGVAAGCSSAAALTRYMASFIYGITPVDTLTFTGAAFGMLLIALFAIHVPVRRATRVNPVTALRTD